MSANKTAEDEQDPDYASAGPSDSIHQTLLEETARNNASQTIKSIIEREFSSEIDSKEKEIIEIHERLQSALKTLHFLRYVIISDFYNRKQCVISTLEDSRQTRIHPAIKQVLGKSPKPVQVFNFSQPSTSSGISSEQSHSLGSSTALRVPQNLPEELLEPRESDQNPRKRARDEETPPEPPKKIPRYVPPKSGIPEPQLPSRGVRHKVRRRLVVGNISKWIPPDWREDRASHKWTMYVRGGKENPDIGEFVSKVRFFLDPSYRPNDVVEVRTPPFHLTRRGWGEFRLRIQIHFKNTVTKPVNLFHDLKLDRTYTGLQTLGSETVADIWLDTLNTLADQPISPVPENPPEEPKTRDIVCHVHLEHDYAKMDSTTKIMSGGENNVTIRHSSPPRTDVCPEKSRESVDSEVLKGKNGFVTKTLNGYRENGVSSNLDLSVLASTCVNATEPLSINIPPTFQVDKRIFPTDSGRKNVKNNITSLTTGKQVNCVNLMGKKNSVINIKVNPSKCLLLDNESSVPTLKIADSVIENGYFQENLDINDVKCEKTNLKSLKKNSGDHIKTLRRVDIFEDALREIEDVKITDIEALIRFVIRRLPIITEKSISTDYKKIHPYSCASEKEFLGFSVAKQRALEWYRARVIRTYLKSKNFEESQVWTTREIVVWCRLHGHTPVRLPMRFVGYQASKSTDKELQGSADDFFNSHTESQALLDLQQLQTHSMRLQECATEEIIDIEGLDDQECSTKNVKIIQPMNLISFTVPKDILPLHLFVCETSRQIGVKIGPEEITPGVSHCAAGRILVKAFECFMEDLLRTSLARAWEKNSNGSIPNIITPKDVLEAISSREEFDFLTNSGLGSLQYTDD